MMRMFPDEIVLMSMSRGDSSWSSMFVMGNDDFVSMMMVLMFVFLFPFDSMIVMFVFPVSFMSWLGMSNNSFVSWFNMMMNVMFVYPVSFMSWFNMSDDSMMSWFFVGGSMSVFVMFPSGYMWNFIDLPIIVRSLTLVVEEIVLFSPMVVFFLSRSMLDPVSELLTNMNIVFMSDSFILNSLNITGWSWWSDWWFRADNRSWNNWCWVNWSWSWSRSWSRSWSWAWLNRSSQWSFGDITSLGSSISRSVIISSSTSSVSSVSIPVL